MVLPYLMARQLLLAAMVNGYQTVHQAPSRDLRFLEHHWVLEAVVFTTGHSLTILSIWVPLLTLILRGTILDA